MATLYVRDLSDEALAELKIGAARSRQSLQAYARTLLGEEAATPALEDVVARIGRRATARLSSADVRAGIEAGRRHE
ncbi:antitoxin [Streptomyces sp. NPDC050610]|uniref:FitA-like ribbon-helix-helix domain-containing protein n=1 Tax=Streptomyces sp. NPDC050610 TaxID=3157097 RepID=UPI003441F4BE